MQGLCLIIHTNMKDEFCPGVALGVEIYEESMVTVHLLPGQMSRIYERGEVLFEFVVRVLDHSDGGCLPSSESCKSTNHWTSSAWTNPWVHLQACFFYTPYR